MANLLWLQAGACSGNTMSFLDAEEPTAVDLVTDFGLNVLYHPSLSILDGDPVRQLLQDCVDGKTAVDVFVLEGTVIQAPDKSGRYNMFAGRPMMEWIEEICKVAGIVVAVGDCACYGGIPAMAPNPSDSTGLQFHKAKKGGFLGSDFTSKAGLPVVNIPGCPAHPDWITQVVVALAAGRTADIALDDLHRPKTFFTSFTQTGCTRVQFFDYKQDSASFGEGTRSGCLFYEQGCKGPVTHSPCNRILWNRQTSKTRAGHPCTGCTEPEWPFNDLAPGTVFKTQKIAGIIPKELPPQQNHVAYTVLAGLSKITAPKWSKEDMFVV